jgi:hypothetical protein
MGLCRFCVGSVPDEIPSTKLLKGFRQDILLFYELPIRKGLCAGPLQFWCPDDDICLFENRIRMNTIVFRYTHPATETVVIWHTCPDRGDMLTSPNLNDDSYETVRRLMEMVLRRHLARQTRKSKKRWERIYKSPKKLQKDTELRQMAEHLGVGEDALEKFFQRHLLGPWKPWWRSNYDYMKSKLNRTSRLSD